MIGAIGILTYQGVDVEVVLISFVMTKVLTTHYIRRGLDIMAKVVHNGKIILTVDTAESVDIIEFHIRRW